MFLKLTYVPSRLRFSGKYLFQEHQISAGKLPADSSSKEPLYRGAPKTVKSILEGLSSWYWRRLSVYKKHALSFFTQFYVLFQKRFARQNIETLMQK